MSIGNCHGKPIQIQALDDLYKVDKAWPYQIAFVLGNDAGVPSNIFSYDDGGDKIIRGWVLSAKDCSIRNKEACIELIQWETEEGVVTFEARIQSIYLIEYESGSGKTEVNMHFSDMHPQYHVKEILLYPTTNSDYSHALSRAIAHDINLSCRVFEETYTALNSRIEAIDSAKTDILKFISICVSPGIVEWIFKSTTATTVAMCFAIPLAINVLVSRYFSNHNAELHRNELQRLTREFYI